MRKLKFLSFIIVVIITACKQTSKINSNNASIVNTAKSTTESQVVTQTQPVEGKLNVNTMFFDGSGTSFTYIINENYCILNTAICSYTYDATNAVIAINYAGIMKDQADAVIYYKVVSGYEVRNKGYDLELNVSKIEQNYDLNSNLSNPSFALVQMDIVSLGRYQLRRGNSDRVSIYKPLETDKILNNYSYALDGLSQSLNSINQPFLITENKVDVIKNMGESNVDAVLANKTDYTYKSLISSWEKLSSKKNKAQNFYNLHQNVDISQPYKPSLFTELISSLIAVKQVKNDNERYNQLLDNEVLPLLQQTN